MLRVALVSAFLIGCIPASNAQDVRVVGAGMLPCERWLSRSDSGSYQNAMEQWLVGFVSGVNSAVKAEVMGGEDYDTLVKWMDRYCAAHRTNLLKEGARELVLDLVRKNNKPR